MIYETKEYKKSDLLKMTEQEDGSKFTDTRTKIKMYTPNKWKQTNSKGVKIERFHDEGGEEVEVHPLHKKRFLALGYLMEKPVPEFEKVA